ncbi:hypothetical protein ACNOYE_01175 [Nannocystaceae bacterium ST9]
MDDRIAAHQLQLERIAREVAELGLARFESSSMTELRRELIPRLAGSVDASRVEFVALLDDLGPLAGDEGTKAAMANLSDLADIAAMARWELDRHSVALSGALEYTDNWRAISECGVVRHRLLEGLLQVEHALCQLEGRASLCCDLVQTELTVALAIRRGYQVFRLATRALEQRMAKGEIVVGQALRSTTTNLAKLVGRDAYEAMRVDERRQVRSLQARILRWAGEGMGDHLAAHRLWLDIVAFTQLLDEVQTREILLEHDHGLIEAMLDELDAPRIPRDALPLALHERLSPLLGRDVELDALLLEREPSLAPWAPVLRRLASTLARALGRDTFMPSIDLIAEF